MSFVSNIYSLVRDALIEEGKSIPQIAKMLRMPTDSIESIVKAILDYNQALNNNEYYKIRSMIVDDYLSPANVAKLLDISQRCVRYSLLDMEDEDVSKDVYRCSAWVTNPCDSDSESSDEDTDTDTSSETTETTQEVADTKPKTFFSIPTAERTHTKLTLYFNHGDRDQFDTICVERLPKQEKGIYYITYTGDVPNGKYARSMKSRSILEASGLNTVLDYIKDTFDLLEIDTQNFKSVDIMTSVYPCITTNIGTMLEKRELLLRIIEDSLVSERFEL